MEKRNDRAVRSVIDMDIKFTYSMLAVDDHEKALAFYRDVLGFEVRNDVGYQDMRWVTIGSPTQPDVSIVLEPPCVEGSPSDKELIRDLMAKGLFGRIVLATDDVDKTFEVIAASGADVIQEPIDQPYGVRDCAFRDPAGNVVRINQPLN